MDKVTFFDMNNRIKALSSLKTNHNSILIETAYDYSKNGRNNDIYKFIENCTCSNEDIQFDVYMSLFDKIIESRNENYIIKTGEYILENVVPKVRDSKQTQVLIKRRLGRLKGKLNNNKKITTQIQTKFPSKVNTVTKQQTQTQSVKEDAIIEELYEQMLEKLYVYENYDRVASNYNNISKRFNLESFFIDREKQSTYDTVVELCELIDTYGSSNSTKFSIVIETAWYGYESLRIPYNKKEVLESAVDYFCFKEAEINNFKEIIDSTIFYDGIDKNLDIFMEDDPEGILRKDSIDDKIRHSINSYYIDSKSLLKESAEKDDKEETKFNKLFNKFKKEELKEGSNPASKLKSLVTSLYAKNVDGIIEGTPKLLSWIRAFFIVGLAAVPGIGLPLAVIGVIADRFIELNLGRSETKKMIDFFNSEIKKTEDKLEMIDDNKEEKENLTKYLKSLNDAKYKIEKYYNDLHTEEENDKRMSDEYSNSDYNSDDDFDFSDLEEFFVLNTISDKINSFLETDLVLTENEMYELAKRSKGDSIKDIATISSLYPEEFYKESVRRGIEDHLKDINNNSIKYESIVDKVIEKDLYENALSILNFRKPIEKPVTMYEANEYLDNVIENTELLKTLYQYGILSEGAPILEVSLTNRVKMALMKLKKNAVKLSDKEKNISREIDRTANSFANGIEKSLTQSNRESVLRGTILPSASKIIKLGLIDAGLVAIGQPVLAVIATLGYLGASHLSKNKERQYVIDELEIELKMCQKYIDLAESNGDMKALKQCLTIQRSLQRQLQKVKYKMKVDLSRKGVDYSYLDNVDDVSAN